MGNNTSDDIYERVDTILLELKRGSKLMSSTDMLLNPLLERYQAYLSLHALDDLCMKLNEKEVKLFEEIDSPVLGLKHRLYDLGYKVITKETEMFLTIKR
jgi:hypothetical protein